MCIRDRIYAGEVQANPYELNGSTGCDYCAYRDICGFDPRLDGYAYRSLEKYSKMCIRDRVYPILVRTDILILNIFQKSSLRSIRLKLMYSSSADCPSISAAE